MQVAIHSLSTRGLNLLNCNVGAFNKTKQDSTCELSELQQTINTFTCSKKYAMVMKQIMRHSIELINVAIVNRVDKAFLNLFRVAFKDYIRLKDGQRNHDNNQDLCITGKQHLQYLRKPQHGLYPDKLSVTSTLTNENNLITIEHFCMTINTT